MKKTLWALGALVLGLGVFTSCDKNNDEPYVGPEVGQVKTFTIDATAFEKFVYFNFETGKQVDITDEESATSSAWDIAFHRYDFRTNSGTANASGKGGAAVTTGEDITAAVAIPDAANFKVDVNKSIVVQYGGAPTPPNYVPTMKTEERAISPVLTTEVKPGVPMPTKDEDFVSKGAIWSMGMPPAYYTSSKVYIIRTANGKFARFKVTAYKGTLTVDGKNASKNGYVEFQYVYPVN